MLVVQEHIIFAASFNFGKMLLLDTKTGAVLAVLSDRRRTMRAIPEDAPGAHTFPQAFQFCMLTSVTSLTLIGTLVLTVSYILLFIAK